MLKSGKLLFFFITTAITAILAYLLVFIIQNNEKKYGVVHLAECRPSIYKLPHYLALENSFYKDQLIKIRPVECQSDNEALSALEGGQADIALVGTASLIFRISGELKEGSNLAAFASLNRTATYHLVSRENTALDDIKSLKNKIIIAGGQDSEETIFLEHILRDGGLSPYESVTIITNIPEEIKMGALKAGTGHYLMLENNDLPTALSRGFFKIKSFQTNFPSVICVTTRDFEKNRPQVLQGFTNAVYMGMVWMKYHTAEETTAACRNTHGIERVIFSQLVKNCYDSSSFGESPVIQANELDALVGLMDRCREIPMPVNSSELIDNRPALSSVRSVHYVPEDKQKKSGLQKLKFWE